MRDHKAEPTGGPHRDRRVGFAEVLSNRTFLALYIAEAQSVIGDQLARVALSVLVFQETGSTAQTALIYALTFLPAIVGGGLLSGLADRYSRRAVMVTADVLRAGLLGAMALPSQPLPALYTLLVVAVLLGPAFRSAEVSLIAEIFDGEHYRVATGLRLLTSQIAQVAGFAVGGAIVAAFTPRWALAVDAATFLASALIVGLLAGGPAATAGAHRQHADRSTPSTLRDGLRMLWRDHPLRWLIALSWLAGFFTVPEALAAPYAHSLGRSSSAVGVLLTAIPLGSVLGALVLLRAIPASARAQASAPLAVLAGLPLVACAAYPPLGVSALLWALSGAFAAYQIDTITAIVRRVAEAWRGRAIGIVSAGLTASQGVGFIAFGLIAGATGAGRAIAMAGAIGSLSAGLLWIALQGQHASTMPVAIVDQPRSTDG